MAWMLHHGEVTFSCYSPLYLANFANDFRFPTCNRLLLLKIFSLSLSFCRICIHLTHGRLGYSWIDVADNFHAFQSNPLFMRHVWPLYRIRIDKMFEMITLRLTRIYVYCMTTLEYERKEKRRRERKHLSLYSKLII